MTVDVLFTAWNRLDYTRVTYELLIENTDWSSVRRLIVYDDASVDGTAEYLADAIYRCPAASIFESRERGGPVAMMLDYLRAQSDRADAFVKIDNDIAVPPGWLPTLLDTASRYPDVELLGMQAGMTGEPPDGYGDPYEVRYCSHIGGVGLMRVPAFRDRPPMVADGRFGFTQWQERHGVTTAWVMPDLRCPQLDLIPDEPFASLSAVYTRVGWQRQWPPYHPASRSLWSWIPTRTETT